MHVSDLDIEYSAHLYIQLHGHAAAGKARAMVEQMRAKGDVEGMSTWLRMIVAIISLGGQQTEARRQDGFSMSP